MGFIWISFFLVACNDFVIIVSTITWYFSRKSDHGEEGHSSVWVGFYWIYRYNFGGLAVGSLILSIVWIIRSLFEWLGEKMMGAHSENGCAKCMISCCSCCLDCFDRFIRYLTENAYIYMAFTSESFCHCALHSFMIILKNSRKFAFTSTVANIFMYLAKVAVSLGATMTCWSIMNASNGKLMTLENSFGPLLLIFMSSYLTTAIFISVFHTSATTILQCFLLDREISLQKGHFNMDHVPEALRKFLNEFCKDELISLECEAKEPEEQKKMVVVSA